MNNLIKELKVYVQLLEDDVARVEKGNKTATIRFRRNIRHSKQVLAGLKLQSEEIQARHVYKG